MRSSPLQRALKRGPNLILLEVWLDKVLLEIVRAELIRFANALTGYKCLSSYTHVCVCVLYVCVCVCMCVPVLCVWVCGYACVYVCILCMCVRVFVCVYMCCEDMWVCVCVCIVCVYVCVFVCVYTHCVWVWVCVCICIYIVCVCACMYDIICQNECVPSVQKDSTSETRHALKLHPQMLF